MKKSILLSIIFWTNFIFAQSGNIINFKKISATDGFVGITADISGFGRTICNIGDLNLDGIEDIAVTCFDWSKLEGNFFILFMDKAKNITSYKRIGPNLNGFNGTFINSMSTFGTNLISINDLDSNGVKEIVACNWRGGTNNKGECYLLFMNIDGTIKKYKRFGENEFPLINNESFGISMTNIGDLDSDQIDEIAISSIGNKDGGAVTGIIYIIYFTKAGDIRRYKKISGTNGNFKGVFTASLGISISGIGDLNDDGVNDIITSTESPSALWVMFLDTSGIVKSHQKISSDSGGYSEAIKPTEGFGNQLSNLGDIDGDGNNDIAVSSPSDSVNGFNTGRVRILFMNSNGVVKSIKRIDNNAINFNNITEQGELFGIGLSKGFDFNGDFKKDLIIGADSRDDGGENKGAIYLLSLDGAIHPTPPKALWRVNATSGNQNTVFNFTQYSSGFPSSYKWSFTPNTVQYQNGTTDTSANPIVKFTQTANYSAQLKVTNPFTSDSLLRSNYINIQTTGLFTPNIAQLKVELFPNPTSSSITIQSPIIMQSILVYDITGKQLLQQTPNAQTDELNLTELNTGIYVVKIETTHGTETYKISKQ